MFAGKLCGAGRTADGRRMDSSLRSGDCRGRAKCKRDRSGKARPSRGRNATCGRSTFPVSRSPGSGDPAPMTIHHGRRVGLSRQQPKGEVPPGEWGLSMMPESGYKRTAPTAQRGRQNFSQLPGFRAFTRGFVHLSRLATMRPETAGQASGPGVRMRRPHTEKRDGIDWHRIAWTRSEYRSIDRFNGD
jgi:hypothetical protein